MAEGVPYAPEQILKLVKCGCVSERPCKGAKCGCMAHQLPYKGYKGQDITRLQTNVQSMLTWSLANQCSIWHSQSQACSWSGHGNVVQQV